MCSLYESRDLEPLPEPEIKKLFKQLIDAVAYIHLKGVVHLDLKLENVLLDKQNRVRTFIYVTAYLCPGQIDRLWLL